MAAGQTVQAKYQRQAEEKKAAVAAQERGFGLVGNLRLAVGIVWASMGFLVFGPAAVHPIWLVIPGFVFVALVVWHGQIVERLGCARRALRFYEAGLARVEDRWMGAGEQGVRFRDPNHLFADDIDIFGKGSLFERLCTARTYEGEQTLAKWLTSPATEVEILERQQEVDALAPRLDLREDLALAGEDARAELRSAQVLAWGKAPAVLLPAWLPWVAGFVSMAVVVSFAAYLKGQFGKFDRIPLLASLLIEFVLFLTYRNRVSEVVEGLELKSRDLGVLEGLARVIEREPGGRLAGIGGTASRRIAQLRGLAAACEWDHNQFFSPIAFVLLWRIQLAVRIEAWRRHSGARIEEWIDTIGQFEALSALAAYRFERPDDPFPEIAAGGPLFDAAGLGHPLLADARCVLNDVRIANDMPLLVVSGSNMSGKSTLMRAVGLNAVLAMAGAPVRAKRLRLSPLQIGASMRTVDSLQDGKSRFYAEITRLREIVAISAGPIPVLFLLDELLSGTNSHDRRIGAAAIIRSLIRRSAIGMITTHDLALADIAKEIQPPGTNVHFADTLESGVLHFDYRLHAGVVDHSNALELMRSVGLEV